MTTLADHARSMIASTIWADDRILTAAEGIGDEERVFSDLLHFSGIQIMSIPVGDNMPEGCHVNALTQAQGGLRVFPFQPVSDVISSRRHLVGNFIGDLYSPCIAAFDEPIPEPRNAFNRVIIGICPDQCVGIKEIEH